MRLAACFILAWGMVPGCSWSSEAAGQTRVGVGAALGNVYGAETKQHFRQRSLAVIQEQSRVKVQLTEIQLFEVCFVVGYASYS